METTFFVDIRPGHIATTVGGSEAVDRYYRLSLSAAATLMNDHDSIVEHRVDKLLQVRWDLGQEKEVEKPTGFYRLMEISSIAKRLLREFQRIVTPALTWSS